MSEQQQDRMAAGERTSARLLRREARRPRVGLSPMFYARFGLEDPWQAASQPGADSEGLGYTFLSARPYYDMLRRLAEARSRREARLARLSRQGEPRLRAARRLWPGEAGTSALAGLGLGASVLAESALIFPAPPLAAPVNVEQVEGTRASSRARVVDGWTGRSQGAPARPSASLSPRPVIARPTLADPSPISPSAPGFEVGGGDPAAPSSVRRTSSSAGRARPAGREEAASVEPSAPRARRAARPLEQVGRRVAAASAGGDPASPVQVVIQAAGGRVPRRLERILAVVEQLPAEEQVRVLRRVTRRLGGAGALMREELEARAPEVDASATSVAAGRIATDRGVRRGLRPVMASSPMMQAVQAAAAPKRPEPPAPATSPWMPARKAAQQRAAAAPGRTSAPARAGGGAAAGTTRAPARPARAPAATSAARSARSASGGGGDGSPGIARPPVAQEGPAAQRPRSSAYTIDRAVLQGEPRRTSLPRVAPRLRSQPSPTAPTSPPPATRRSAPRSALEAPFQPGIEEEARFTDPVAVRQAPARGGSLLRRAAADVGEDIVYVDDVEAAVGDEGEVLPAEGRVVAPRAPTAPTAVARAALRGDSGVARHGSLLPRVISLDPEAGAEAEADEIGLAPPEVSGDRESRTLDRRLGVRVAAPALRSPAQEVVLPERASPATAAEAGSEAPRARPPRPSAWKSPAASAVVESSGAASSGEAPSAIGAPVLGRSGAAPQIAVARPARQEASAEVLSVQAPGRTRLRTAVEQAAARQEIREQDGRSLLPRPVRRRQQILSGVAGDLSASEVLAEAVASASVPMQRALARIDADQPAEDSLLPRVTRGVVPPVSATHGVRRAQIAAPDAALLRPDAPAAISQGGERAAAGTKPARPLASAWKAPSPVAVARMARGEGTDARTPVEGEAGASPATSTRQADRTMLRERGAAAQAVEPAGRRAAPAASPVSDRVRRAGVTSADVVEEPAAVGEEAAVLRTAGRVSARQRRVAAVVAASARASSSPVVSEGVQGVLAALAAPPAAIGVPVQASSLPGARSVVEGSVDVAVRRHRSGPLGYVPRASTSGAPQVVVISLPPVPTPPAQATSAKTPKASAWMPSRQAPATGAGVAAAAAQQAVSQGAGSQRAPSFPSIFSVGPAVAPVPAAGPVATTSAGSTEAPVASPASPRVVSAGSSAVAGSIAVVEAGRGMVAQAPVARVGRRDRPIARLLARDLVPVEAGGSSEAAEVHHPRQAWMVRRGEAGTALHRPMHLSVGPDGVVVRQPQPAASGGAGGGAGASARRGAGPTWISPRSAAPDGRRAQQPESAAEVEGVPAPWSREVWGRGRQVRSSSAMPQGSFSRAGRAAGGTFVSQRTLASAAEPSAAMGRAAPPAGAWGSSRPAWGAVGSGVDFVLPRPEAQASREGASAAAAAEGSKASSGRAGAWLSSRPPLPWTLEAVDTGTSSHPGLPVWAQRASGAPRVRGSEDFLSALAQASDVEEVVRVIFARAEAPQPALRKLGSPVLQVIQQIRQAAYQATVTEATAAVLAADSVSSASASVASSAPGQAEGGRRSGGRQERSGVAGRTVAAGRKGQAGPRSTARVASGMTGLRPMASAPRGQGVGEDRVMRLAARLRELIHLAEHQRRDEARQGVRMAEDSASARSEGQSSPTHSEGGDGHQRQVDIDALVQEVLGMVQGELDGRKQRRLDGSGDDVFDPWW